MHPALRDANLTGDEIRPLMLVGNQLYRVFAPDWHRLGKRLLTMTTTGQNPAPNTLPEQRLITNGTGRQEGLVTSNKNIIIDYLKCGGHRHHLIPIIFDLGVPLPRRYHHIIYL